MIKKQYIFLIMIGIILYIFYLIVSFTYKEYKINSHIEYIIMLNKEIKQNISEANSTIKYKKSKAYKNKILKQQQSLKNAWEKVIYLTTEQKYNKYTQKIKETKIDNKNNNNSISNITDWMTIFEKWIYTIFKKDIR